MKTIGKILALALTGATLALGSGAIAQEKTWTKVRIATEGARQHLSRLGFEVPPPRRAEPEMVGLWEGEA